MSEHHITIPRTARYFTLGTLTPATREVWIVLHGYAQLAEHFLRSFRLLDDGSRVIVAPEALSRFYRDGTGGHVGASWMTKADREQEIDDYVGYLDMVAREILTPDARSHVRFVALGFSQGAAAAARWSCRGSFQLDAVVLWGGTLPPEISASRYAGRLTGLHLVVGTRDEYRDDASMVAEQERLRQSGIRFEWIEFDGTHRIEREPLERVAASIERLGPGAGGFVGLGGSESQRGAHQSTAAT